MLTDPFTLAATAKLTSTYRVRQVIYLVEFNWAKDASDLTDPSSGTWINETTFVTAASGSSQFMPVERRVLGTGVIPPAQAAITLNNTAGRFSPYRTDGALYANIGGGKIFQTPVRIWAGLFDPTPTFAGALLADIVSPTAALAIVTTESDAMTAGEIIKIDNEYMLIVKANFIGGGTTHCTVRRGIYNTTATTHDMDADVNILGAMVRIFTGVIADPSEQSESHHVTFTCYDRSHLIGQYQASTIAYKDQLPDALIGLFMDTLTGVAGAPSYLPVPDAQQAFDFGNYLIPNGFMEAESPLVEASLVAVADGGVFWFNSEGQARFYNGSHFVGAASAYTLDHQNTIAFVLKDDRTNVFNTVTARYAPRALSPSQVVWTSNEPVVIAPNGGTFTTTAKFRFPCDVVTTPVANTDFFVATSGGDDLSADVTITSFVAYALHAAITFTNAHATQQAYLGNLRVRGQPFLGAVTQTVSETRTTSPTNITPRDLALPENYYRQSFGQVSALCTFVADRVKTVRPSYTCTFKGNPLLELGDMVTFDEDISLTTDRTAFIDSLNWNLSPKSGFTQNITTSDASDWYQASNYHIVGTTALGSGSVWY